MLHAAQLSVLADPTRLRILELLTQNTYCTSDLAPLLGVSIPAVSQHMKILQAAGFVTACRCGNKMQYIIDRGLLKTIASEINSIADTQSGVPAELRDTSTSSTALEQPNWMPWPAGKD